MFRLSGQQAETPEVFDQKPITSRILTVIGARGNAGSSSSSSGRGHGHGCGGCCGDGWRHRRGGGGGGGAKY